MAAHLQKASCQLLDLQFGQQRAGQQWSACMQQLQHLLLPIKLKKNWGGEADNHTTTLCAHSLLHVVRA